MGSGTNPPVEQARSIFAALGYEIAGTGRTFSATRAWREVTVSAVTDPPDSVSGSGYRCFVTWEAAVATLRQELEDRDPAGDWALIAVGREGEYEVARTPTGT